MNDLAMELVRLCLHNRDGSMATQANRRRGLVAMANDLYALGYRPGSAASLKPKHVSALIHHWAEQGVSQATVKNRMGWIRWWAEKVNKASVVPRDNSELGIANREASDRNRAWQLPPNFHIASPHMNLSIRLMAAFGLRVEEALKIRPSQADAGEFLRLQGSWTKGGRPRTIPIRTLEQRALLQEAKRLVGKNSMIPTDLTFIRHRKRLEYEALKRGLNNLHGLRHAYAQSRYAELTGWPCPKAGGPARKALNADDQLRDILARRTIAEELGHGRISVTTIYLG